MLLKKTLLAAALVAFGGLVASTPATAAATATGSFNVTMTITSFCKVSSTNPVAVASQVAGANTNVHATTANAINVNCSIGTPYNIGLVSGNQSPASTTGAGEMKGATSGALVPYQLYSDSGYSKAWGSTIGTNTVSSTGTGVLTAAQAFPVYVTVPSTDFTPDSYTDAVAVTVTY